MAWLRLSNRSLGAQFWVAGSIVGIFSVASLLLLLNQVSRQTEASRWLARTHRTISRLNSLGRDYYQHRTLLRGYLELPEGKRLEQARERGPLWQKGLEAVRDSIALEPDAQAPLDQVAKDHENWLRQAEGLTLNRPMDMVDREGELGYESELFEKTWNGIDALIDRFNRQLSVRDLEDKQAVQHTFAAVAVINIALLLVFGVVLLNLYQSIARPIAALSTGIRRYMGGDFRARVRVGYPRSDIGYLQSSYNELAERIENMVKDLRRLDEMKSDFLSTVSHELRTPLTSIGGYVKLVLSGDAGELAPTQREFLYIVDTNVVRLTHLINDLLDVEKIESGKMQLVREPQDITAVLRECRDTLGILAKQKGLELKYRVTDTPTYVVGDRARLVQIFMNLLSNALKYTKKGSVELSLEQKDYALMIRVRDTGVGLRADELEQLFQKFYRGRSALESAEQGTGLGLVIVRGLVEAHGGTISAESEEGVGTTFTVSLPVEELASVMVEDVRESRGHQMARDEGSLPEGWKRTVWHVGGDAEKAKRLSEMLADPDFSVRGYRLRFEWFSSAENMPQDRSPELIVAEGGMASSDGVGGIKRRVGGRTPILVLGERQQASDVFSWGAAAFLNKPVKREQLAAAVKDLLHSRGRRVLLADPNTDARLLVKRGLEQRGFEVDDVDRGNQVLGRLEKETYDLLVLERDLPDVPAMEILKVVQRIPRYGGLRVVLLENAGGIAAAERREFEALGVGRFVAKYEGIDPTVDSVCRYLEEGRASSQ